ncbi:PREDICTED: RNA pseudouridylate synthase domain-containing protein 3 isoform X1 [Chinchilla lanigera]|uniref:RNA pseudouridylate synthase domain-containing protein 3 isoform X1 n=1 Tax=Chinchilla lanigera TaxID=34839 RepID=UPI00038EF753|nr:PREDICTED: RNA pseudouridylate synthase domain-containing protein 3 isoform X1 [Chinchilla lanigera]
MGAGLDAHAHSASREMGALVAWGRGVGGWRLALGARLPPWDAGFCTEPGLQSWRGGDREALLLELRAAVVEHRGPLVTLNKPQGLPVTGKPGELTLLSVLPDLSQSLGCPSLQVIRAPGKETSGLVLLSTCPQTASRLQKFFIRSRRAHRPTATYWAVTNGIPDASEGQILAALTLQHIGGVSVVIPVKCPSRRDLLEGVKRTLSHFRVMATGSGCALIQLQPLTLFPSQLQVHMMLQLCPVLGDHTYSARAGTVLGQRFLLSAENTKPQRQALDDALLRRLHLTPAQAAQLPLHLHLHQLLLPGSRPADAPIELRAPLPRYFSRTLQCLGLCQQ